MRRVIGDDTPFEIDWCSIYTLRCARLRFDLAAIYSNVYSQLQPKYGHWAIFDHCLPFDVSRAYDEATQFADPRIWTAERDKEMWTSLEDGTPRP